MYKYVQLFGFAKPWFYDAKYQLSTMLICTMMDNKRLISVKERQTWLPVFQFGSHISDNILFYQEKFQTMKTDELIAMVFLMGILPITILVIWFLIVKIRHKERMSLIEKGIDITTGERKSGPFQDVLMWGMLSIGIGTGLLIAYILLEKAVVKDDMILGTLSILFGGIGLIGYYLFRRKGDRK